MIVVYTHALHHKLGDSIRLIVWLLLVSSLSKSEVVESYRLRQERVEVCSTVLKANVSDVNLLLRYVLHFRHDTSHRAYMVRCWFGLCAGWIGSHCERFDVVEMDRSLH